MCRQKRFTQISTINLQERTRCFNSLPPTAQQCASVQWNQHRVLALKQWQQNMKKNTVRSLFQLENGLLSLFKIIPNPQTFCSARQCISLIIGDTIWHGRVNEWITAYGLCLAGGYVKVVPTESTLHVILNTLPLPPLTSSGHSSQASIISETHSTSSSIHTDNRAAVGKHAVNRRMSYDICILES